MGTSGLDAEAVEALRALALGYAEAMDRRSPELLREVFTADAVLEVVRPGGGEPVSRYEGIDALEAIPPALGRWASTVHHVVGGRYAADGPDPDAATGSVECEAHHLTHRADGLEDRILRITYADRYRRTADGWRLSARRVEIREDVVVPFGSARPADEEDP